MYMRIIRLSGKFVMKFKKTFKYFIFDLYDNNNIINFISNCNVPLYLLRVLSAF